MLTGRPPPSDVEFVLQSERQRAKLFTCKTNFANNIISVSIAEQYAGDSLTILVSTYGFSHMLVLK